MTEQDKFDQLYPFWRFHLWGNNHGSYETIEEKIERGELRPFLCPDEGCDCRWPKQSEASDAPERDADTSEVTYGVG